MEPLEHNAHKINNKQMESEAEKLDRPIDREEFNKEIMNIKEGLPGEDNVRICYIKHCEESTKQNVFEYIKKMSETHPEEWNTFTQSGFVIPLFKKGARDV